jgi:hypothetical protein
MLPMLPMSETEAMNIDERRKYIHKMWRRYRKSKKLDKGRLLDEIEAVTGMHRKAIIRLLNGRLSRKKRSRERGREYGVEVGDALHTVYDLNGSKTDATLQGNLNDIIQHFFKYFQSVPFYRALPKYGQSGMIWRTLIGD